MKKKKKQLCPVCKNILIPVFMPHPMGMGQYAIGILTTKGEPRVQVRCSSCGASMFKKPEDFQDQQKNP